MNYRPILIAQVSLGQQKMRNVIAVGIVANLIGGCVTIPSNIVTVGPDTYTLNMTGVGFATQGNTNIKAMSQASAYCEKLHKHMLLKNQTENGVYGFSPRQATLTFQCLNVDDPAYVQKN